MKKKFIGAIILGSLAFLLASCDFPSGATNNNGESGNTVEVNENDERYKIYLLALDQGYTGSYQEWLDSIKGASISLQVANGYIQMKYSNETQWINLISINELKGEDGSDGSDGRSTELKVADGFIQWKYENEGSNSWRNLISLSALTGSEGKAGKEIELSVNDEYILWKYTGDEIWNNLISLSTITGKDGKPGKEVELSVNNEYIVWRYKDTDEWFELVELNSIRGKTGVGISLVEINNDGELVLTYSDGSVVNAGKVKEDTAFDHTYTVTFDVLGSDDDLTQVVPWGGGPQEPTMPEKEGYGFDGWYIGDRKWDFYTNYYPYDMTLTGKYISLPFRITLYTNGGTVENNEIVVKYDSEYTLPTPTKAGYSFLGWYDEDGNKVEDGTWKRTQNTDLYASWQANQLVTVTFNPNGGEIANTTEQVAVGSYYVAPKPTRYGYKFLGWGDPYGRLFDAGYFEYNTDTTFFAVWKESYDDIVDKTINISVPVLNGLDDLVEAQVSRYLQSIDISPSDYNINVELNYSPITSGFENTSDIYCLDQDQLAIAARRGFAISIPSEYATNVTNRNISSIVDGLTLGDYLYGYPLSLLSGIMMYYNKSLFDEVDMNSLEQILGRCEETGYYFGYDLNTSWYSAGFFFGTGCKSEWYTDNNGNFIDLDDTFNSTQGKVALSGIYKLVNTSCWKSTSDASLLASSAVGRCGVVITGSWGDSDAKSSLGDDYAVCKLPSFVGSDGKTYQIGSYTSGRVICIKPQEDSLKETLLNKIAYYLSSEECQMERFELNNGYLPTFNGALLEDALQDVSWINAFCSQTNYAVAQKAIYGNWWTVGDNITNKVKSSDGSDSAFETILNQYTEAIYESLEIRPAFYGYWQDFDSEDATAYMERNADGEYEVTFTIDSDYKFGKIYKRGSIDDAFADYRNVDDDSKVYLDLTTCEGDTTSYFIYFAENGTYTVTYNKLTNIIHITKED